MLFGWLDSKQITYLHIPTIAATTRNHFPTRQRLPTLASESYTRHIAFYKQHGPRDTKRCPPKLWTGPKKWPGPKDWGIRNLPSLRSRPFQGQANQRRPRSSPHPRRFDPFWWFIYGHKRTRDKGYWECTIQLLRKQKLSELWTKKYELY